MARILRIAALILALGLVGALVFGGGVFAELRQEKQAKQAAYVCPMGDYESDKPGKCPKCGMELVKNVAAKENQSGHDMSAMGASSAMPQQHGGTHAGHDKQSSTPPAGPAATTAKPGERKILYWYDPMHPQYKSDKPGKAPDCGMDLVPKYAEESSSMQMAPGAVMIPAERQQLIGIRTAKVERQALVREVRTSGQVSADESKIAHVHVKVNGFLEKVFVDYVGQEVKKGQPLFTLYSPDLVATQQEYLIALRGQKALGGSAFAEVSQGANSLLDSARERLRLWDISEEQIKQLSDTGQVSRTLTFYSPIRGVVMDRKAYPQTAVGPETELYTVADLSTVWVNADVYEYEVPYVKVGQRAEMQLSYYLGRTWLGRVAFIYPTVDPMTRTVKVRLEFPNPKMELKPQMFADVQLKIDYGRQVLIPQEAVLDSGKEKTVFVAHEGGYFEPRRVTTGAKLEGKVAVLSGLKPGETIVTSGNFLIDSESQLKSAMEGMQH